MGVRRKKKLGPIWPDPDPSLVEDSDSSGGDSSDQNVNGDNEDHTDSVGVEE